MNKYEKAQEYYKKGYLQINSSRGVLTMLNDKFENVIIKTRNGEVVEVIENSTSLGKNSKETIESIKFMVENGKTFTSAVAHHMYT